MESQRNTNSGLVNNFKRQAELLSSKRILRSCTSTLNWSLVTTAWRVLRLRMKEKASRNGGRVAV